MSDTPPSPEGPSLEETVGFNQILGFRLTEWREGFARVELDLDHRHLNRSGILHGGVMSTLLDAALGYCGCYAPETQQKRRAVTLSMAISFLGQARSGTIACTAEQRGGGRTIFMGSGEIRGADGTLLATGQGVFRYIAGTGPG